MPVVEPLFGPFALVPEGHSDLDPFIVIVGGDGGKLSADFFVGEAQSGAEVGEVGEDVFVFIFLFRVSRVAPLSFPYFYPSFILCFLESDFFEP